MTGFAAGIVFQVDTAQALVAVGQCEDCAAATLHLQCRSDTGVRGSGFSLQREARGPKRTLWPFGSRLQVCLLCCCQSLSFRIADNLRRPYAGTA
jgi:hypothetical protein